MIDEQLKNIADSLGAQVYRFSGKSVLISGASGFLGSWFIAFFDYLNKKELIREPVKVTAIDSFIAADKDNSLLEQIDGNIEFMKGDVSTIRHFVRPYDFIIHAAGIASPVYYRKYPLETIDGMVLGCRNMLDYARQFGCESMLVFSSSEIYGNPDAGHIPTREDYNGNVSSIGPRSCYDESKRMEEAYCVAYCRIHQVPVKMVRPFNVYGPGMRIKDDRVAPKFIVQALTGTPLTVHTPGSQTRTLCYITDALEGFLRVLLYGQDGEVYNIGAADPELTMERLAEIIQDLIAQFYVKHPEADHPATVIDRIPMPKEYPTDQAARRCPDLMKALRDVAYKPVVPLDKGLSLTIEWFYNQLSLKK